LSVSENFTISCNVWRHARSITLVDFAVLEDIHLNRIPSAEQWFAREEDKGQRDEKGSLWYRVQPESMQTVLKPHEDGFESPVAIR
jgi:hypothetical protein